MYKSVQAIYGIRSSAVTTYDYKCLLGMKNLCRGTGFLTNRDYRLKCNKTKYIHVTKLKRLTTTYSSSSKTSCNSVVSTSDSS